MDQVVHLHLRKTGSVCGITKCTTTSRTGFTLIELLVVILIIGVIGSIVAPRLAPRTAKAEREQFVAQLNSLLRAALTQALVTQTLQQVFWDLEKRTIEIRKHTGAYDRAGDPECKPIHIPYGAQNVSIPERFIIKQFSIEGVNELAGSRKLKQVWFYIVPDGVSQQVTVVFADTHEDVSKEEKKLTLVLNPFTVQYEELRE